MRIITWALLLTGPCLVASFSPSLLSPPALKTGFRGARVGPSSPLSTLSMAAGGSDDETNEDGAGTNRRNLIAGLAAGVLGAVVPSANAFDRDVGEIPASGLVFKDTIKVTSFEDPKVKGVALYISDFQRPITERLQKNFFSDPTQASVACAKIGKIEMAPDVYKGKEGEEVFEQAKSLLFKTVRIRRIYDEQAQTLIYVSYSTRFNKNDDDNNSRFKTTTCAIPINEY
uniref:CreA protein n=1 Tax=Hemiselmis tepida TaxID=464990 RepID=A0A6T6VPC6_9CRYP|mmetsp:Transcript_31676/g.80580  ORF Transcript_31676/g.80580 Transcript_31676/m.80580 type:complete len:229 (+) Transcript_31676:107-793(+)